MMPDCPLCLESHTLPLQDQLCRLRFEIINLRLELRELLAGERQLTEMLKQRQSPKNWRLSTFRRVLFLKE